MNAVLRFLFLHNQSQLLEVVGQIRLEDQGSESFNLNNYAFWVQTLYQRINDVCVVYEVRSQIIYASKY